MRPRVAVVGTGVAGLTCTHVSGTTLTSRLRAAPRRAAHEHRVHRAPEGGSRRHGFIVYNEPGTRAWSACSPSSMSSRSERHELPWLTRPPARVPGTSFSTVFASAATSHAGVLRMLGEVARFNGWRTAAGRDPGRLHVARHARRGRWSSAFVDCTWSGSLVDLVGGPDHVHDMPARRWRALRRHGCSPSATSRLAHGRRRREALRRRHLGAVIAKAGPLSSPSLPCGAATTR